MTLGKTLSAGAMATFMIAAPATAAEIVLAASAQGYIAVNGTNDGTGPNNSYAVGNCGEAFCYTGEFRNFFTFDIPTLTGPLTGAALRLDTSGLYLQQNPSITYQVTSTSGVNFAALGTGVFYGQKTYTIADFDVVHDIELSGAALAAIGAGGGSLTISGRVTSPTDFGGGELNQLVFTGTGSAQQLVLTTAAVPEPGTWALMIVGFGAAGAAMRRCRAAAALI